MRISLMAIVASLATAASPAFATTHHVAPDGSGDFPTIQAAIDAITSGDEIVLSDGTFTGDGNWDLNFGTKDLVLRSVNGYEATYLDGGLDGLQDIRHRGLILEGGQTAATRIEGITFQQRFGDFEGGSIRCIGSSPVVRSVRIWKNRVWSRGAGIFVQGGSPTFEDCIFDPGLFDGIGPQGSAIYGEDSWLSVRRCSFDLYGQGVLYLDGGTIEDCTFEHVRAGSEVPGPCIRVPTGQASILRCQFRHGWGSGVAAWPTADVVVSGCVFEDYFSDRCVYGTGTITIRDTTFRSNHAMFGTGAVSWQGSITLDRCLFAQNDTWWNNSSEVDLAGDVLVTHCTFVGNLGGDNGASVEIESGSDASVDHTIIAFGEGTYAPTHHAVRCDGSPASLSVSCSDFFGNAGGDWTGCVAGMSGTNGNFSADPLFCDVANGDFSLQADSPCAPGNTGGCGSIGALGPWCGPLAVEQRSWGSIKSLYR